MTKPNGIAITGASGFLGQRLIAAAVGRGITVRALSRRAQVEGADLQWVTGDLGDRQAIESLLTGVDAVVHCAATLHGTDAEVFASIVDGTRLVAEVALTNHLRMIHLSSLAVVDPSLGRRGGRLDDRAPVDPRARDRGAYTRGKVAAEALLAEPAFAELDLVIVRPGQMMGDGLASVPPSLGVRVGPVRVGLVGTGQPLAVVHIDDVAEAVLALVDQSDPPRQITLVDPLRVSRQELLAACRRHAIPGSHAPIIPFGLCVQPVARVGQMIPGPVGRIARRLAAMDGRERWTSPAASAIGWQPHRLATWLRPPAP